MNKVLFTDTQVQTSLEEINWALDFTKWLEADETIEDPTATLKDDNTGEALATGLRGTPIVDGTKVVQYVKSLVAGNEYELSIVAPIAGSTKKLNGILKIKCIV